MANTSVKLCGVEFKNPVTTASGTFGSGREFSEFINLSDLGAVTVKGVSNVAWEGNETPRVAETYGGMLNSIGLQNPGVDYFIKHDIPFLKQFDTKIIVNVCGKTIEDYVEVVEKLNDTDVHLYELNISCPNVKEGGIAFGTDSNMVYDIVSKVKKKSQKPLIVKLSPNVTDIILIARCAEEAGADGLSLINTLQGMAIDIKKRKPVLANIIGGLSGPAIKPVALRMVYQTAKAVKIPIIAMGGIVNVYDAIEFIMVGATMVAVGTENFRNPYATVEIVKGINEYMTKEGIKTLDEIRGIVN